MTRRQVWQYWCEHCGKHNLSAASIAQHEKHCTKNPERLCRMCKASGGQQLSIAELAACIDISLPDEGLSRLHEKAGNCPACILAALLQCGAHRPGFTLMYPSGIRDFMLYDKGLPDHFDFKIACKAWWDEFNNARNERDGYY